MINEVTIGINTNTFRKNKSYKSCFLNFYVDNDKFQKNIGPNNWKTNRSNQILTNFEIFIVILLQNCHCDIYIIQSTNEVDVIFVINLS